MKPQKLYTYLFVILYWFLTINSFPLVAVLSIKAFISYTDLDPATITNPIALYFLTPGIYLESFSFSFLLSILFIGVNELSEKLRWDRLSFGKIILIKSSVYLIGLVIVTTLTFFIILAAGTFPLENYDAIQWTPHMVKLLPYFLLKVILLIWVLNFILQTAKMIGNYNLKSFLTGKYHNPVKEDRIFLFLDLTSSTTYAEKLGSSRYSRLIKDCFDDLNYLVNRFDADIYQYVGDEIVLTWKTPDGLRNLNVIQVFFAFQNELKRRTDYYTKAYGIVPKFKAGVNCGVVSVAEVGNIKRDIAFHGDVINTTSRIQGVCNQFGKVFLISAQMAERLNGSMNFQLEFLGEHLLRGKHEKIGLYSVEDNSPHD